MAATSNFTVARAEKRGAKTAMFVNAAARARIARWYETFRAALPFETETRTVETSAGATHVLVAGPADAPPLVVLHGAMASSAHVVRELGSLVERYRIYALDVIGQSVMSVDRRLDLDAGGDADADGYPRWLKEATTALGLERFALYGVSWGGFVALKAANAFPAAVSSLVLYVPAGIVAGSAWQGFTELGWPMMVYRLSPNAARLERLIDAMFSSYDEAWAKYFGDALLDYRLDMRVPPLFKAVGYDGPMLVFAGDRDVSFPGNALVERMRVLAPRAEVELLENCKHCPPFDADFREKVARRVGAFLASDR